MRVLCLCVRVRETYLPHTFLPSKKKKGKRKKEAFLQCGNVFVGKKKMRWPPSNFNLAAPVEHSRSATMTKIPSRRFRSFLAIPPPPSSLDGITTINRYRGDCLGIERETPSRARYSYTFTIRENSRTASDESRARNARTWRFTRSIGVIDALA